MWVRCGVNEPADGLPVGSEPCHSLSAFSKDPGRVWGRAPDEMGELYEFPVGANLFSPLRVEKSLQLPVAVSCQDGIQVYV